LHFYTTPRPLVPFPINPAHPAISSIDFGSLFPAQFKTYYGSVPGFFPRRVRIFFLEGLPTRGVSLETPISGGISSPFFTDFMLFPGWTAVLFTLLWFFFLDFLGRFQVFQSLSPRSQHTPPPLLPFPPPLQQRPLPQGNSFFVERFCTGRISLSPSVPAHEKCKDLAHFAAIRLFPPMVKLFFVSMLFSKFYLPLTPHHFFSRSCTTLYACVP